MRPPGGETETETETEAMSARGGPHHASASDDPYDLARFVDAQADCYADAVAELRSGKKRTHWMWFVLPQVKGLGSSAISERYGITGLDEARAYAAHPVLGPRLVECAEALLTVRDRSVHEILGSPDDLKLRSCATLFKRVSTPGSVFAKLLGKYFGGEEDPATVRTLDGD